MTDRDTDIVARGRALLESTTDDPLMTDCKFVTAARALLPELLAEVEGLREWQSLHRGDLASMHALVDEAEDHRDAAEEEASELRAKVKAVRDITGPSAGWCERPGDTAWIAVNDVREALDQNAGSGDG